MSYEQLQYLPRINGVTIIGDKTFSDYGVVPMSASDITEIMLEIFGYVL
jgi:hypothetical protein